MKTMTTAERGTLTADKREPLPLWLRKARKGLALYDYMILVYMSDEQFNTDGPVAVDLEELAAKLNLNRYSLTLRILDLIQAGVLVSTFRTVDTFTLQVPEQAPECFESALSVAS